MANRAVHWYEGMALGPQHLQALQRFQSCQDQRTLRWGLRYNWGVQWLEHNPAALPHYRLEIFSLRACMRDGTLVELPEDGALSALDLREAFEKDRLVTVFLALPSFRTGAANASENAHAVNVRYVVDTQEIEDENTGVDVQPVQFRLINARLLLSSQSAPVGYDVLPLMRVEKSPDASGTPRIATSYISPLIACDAWRPLQIAILRTIFDRVGTKMDLLTEQVASRGIALESHASEDIRIVGQLRALNEAFCTLNLLAFAEGVHPFQAYLELCRLVGQLSLFGERRRPPDLPHYDHDDLGFCFYQVKKYIDALLDLIIEPDWVQRPFIGMGLRMQVTLEPAWLEAAWQMFVGVQSPLPADQCVTLFTKPGILDMKIGSSDRVDRIFEQGQAGLLFTHRPQPRSLPAGLVYFQIDRAAQPAEWQHVQRSLTLAIRLNEQRIAGSINGEQNLTIRNGGQTTTIRFVLYVVRPSS